MHIFRRCVPLGCLALLCLFPRPQLLAQNCECTKNHKKIFEKEKKKWMKGKYEDELVIKEHPYTTFSKFHSTSYYNRASTAAGRLNILRSDLQNFHSTTYNIKDPRREAKKIYNAIYDFADKRIPEPDVKADGGAKSKFPHNTAYLAKNAAFVYMANMDKDGNALADTTAARFRDKAIKCLQYIGDKNEKIDEMVTFATSSGPWPTQDMSTFCQRYSKNLIMYAQAYDYLQAVIQTLNSNDNAVNSSGTHTSSMSFSKNEDLQEEMEWLGLYVQCYAKKLYTRGATIGVSPLFRFDNHALMTASALGLAGVVLNDYSHKKSQDDWHPSTWAHTAHWKINRVLFDEDTKVNISRRGGTYGLSEGPYYLKWGSENMLPFFLAFKNAYPSEIINKSFRDDEVLFKARYIGFTLAKAMYKFDKVAALATLYKTEQLATEWYGPSHLFFNYWDDEDIKNLYRWSTDIEVHTGWIPTLDDSWDEKPFIDKAILRDPQIFNNYLVTGQSHNVGYENSPLVTQGLDYLEDKSVDLRADIYAAFVEGWYDNLNGIYKRNPVQVLSSGDVIIRNSLGNNIDFSNQNNNCYLHINAEVPGQGDQMLGHKQSQHEHDDQLSLLLIKGKQNLLIDPGYMGYTKSKKEHLADPLKHNTVIMDGTITAELGSGILKPGLNQSRNVYTLIGYFYMDGDSVRIKRRVNAFPNKEELIIVYDEITKVSDLDPKDHAFTWSFNGYGTTIDNSFRLSSRKHIVEPYLFELPPCCSRIKSKYSHIF